jgi:ABC-2 type transport system ATP-binding protein
VIIETRALSKQFKSRHGVVEAVKGVDLAVQEGEIFGFLGPNGAGKTTTLRMLTTLIQPSGGRATVAGHDLLRAPGRVRERIGYVSQTGGVDPENTGRANLMLQARLCGLDPGRARARSAELMERLELTGVADRKASTYSGGQMRRFALALGMVHRPPLLFLDEPTVGLDPQSRARLWEEVRSLRDEGTTVFLTTHYLDEADALCDRLAIIDHGSIVAEGTPDELKRRIGADRLTVELDGHDGVIARADTLLRAQPFVRRVQAEDAALHVYVERGEEALPGLLRMLDADGLHVRSIALTRPSLDDVFLEQTGRSLREEAA